MANVILTTIWANGDVLPFVQMGKALRSRGHNVSLITHSHYQEVATAAGLAFRPLDSLEEYQRFVEDGGLFNTPQGFAKIYENYVLPKIGNELKAIEELKGTADGNTVLVARATPGIAARMASEKFNLPLVSIYLGPSYVRTMPLVEELIGGLLGDRVNK